MYHILHQKTRDEEKRRSKQTDENLPPPAEELLIFITFSPPSISTNDRIAMVLSNPSAS
jgi:hypothetical protein